MTFFHKAWRSFVAFVTWLLKLGEADAIFSNNPSYFVDKTLKGHEAEIGGLLTWGRFWKLDGRARHGLGVNALMFIHRDGLAAYASTGRRSPRILLTRLREVVVERALDLLVFIIGAPLILAHEERIPLPLRIVQVFLLAAIAVRIPGFLRWLVSRNRRVRNRIEAFLKRRRARMEARDVREARALLDKAIGNPNAFVIPWTALTEARFDLDAGIRQVMIYGPPAAHWTLAWETRNGTRESALVSVPVRSMGYPELGFADLRLDAELRRVPGGVPQAELRQFAGVPGIQDWAKLNLPGIQL